MRSSKSADHEASGFTICDVWNRAFWIATSSGWPFCYRGWRKVGSELAFARSIGGWGGGLENGAWFWVVVGLEIHPENDWSGCRC